MKLTVNDRQRIFVLNTGGLCALAREFALAAQRRSREALWRELTLIMVDDVLIAQINLAVMGHEGVTDVIAQRYEPIPGEPEGAVCEMFLNVEEAWRRGSRSRRGGWSASHELALYLAHGCDHLGGGEDSTPEGYRRMRRRELRWLARADPIPELYHDSHSKFGDKGQNRVDREHHFT